MSATVVGHGLLAILLGVAVVVAVVGRSPKSAARRRDSARRPRILSRPPIPPVFRISLNGVLPAWITTRRAIHHAREEFRRPAAGRDGRRIEDHPGRTAPVLRRRSGSSVREVRPLIGSDSGRPAGSSVRCSENPNQATVSGPPSARQRVPEPGDVGDLKGFVQRRTPKVGVDEQHPIADTTR